MKKISDKLLIIYLLIQPFLDMLISYGIRNNNKLSYLGVIFRGLFFIVVIVYLFVNKKEKKVLYCFLIYYILAIGHYAISFDYRPISEISNLMQIFYIFFLVFFFNSIDNKYLDDRLLTIVYLIYTLSLPVAKILGIGFDINELYFNKHAYLGLYYSGNELCAILIALVPSVITYLKKSKNILMIVLSVFATLAAIVLLGSKTLVLATILFILYFIFKLRKNKIVLIISIISLILTIAIVPFTSTFKNVVANLKFYNITENNLISIKNVDRLVFSMRLTYAKNLNLAYANGSLLNKVIGIGKTGLNNIKDSEIDATDIFYSIGTIGTTIYLIFMVYLIKNYKLKGIYKYTFILLVIISFFAGHIFTKANVTLFVSLLFKKN